MLHVASKGLASATTALILALLFTAVAYAKDQCVRAQDGDSLIIMHDGKKERVRLIGLDAPELRQEWGKQASQFSQDMCARAKEVRLEFGPERRDRYGRLLAYVYLDDTLLNLELVRQGLAIPLCIRPNCGRYKEIKAAKNAARKAKRGFWEQGGLEMTPSQWRKKHSRK